MKRSPTQRARSDEWDKSADGWYQAHGRDADLHCLACGHLLRGLPARGGFVRCPECGHEAPRYRLLGRRRPQRFGLIAALRRWLNERW